MTTAAPLKIVRPSTLADADGLQATPSEPLHPFCCSCPLWLVLRSIRTEILPGVANPVVLHSIRTWALPAIEARGRRERVPEATAAGADRHPRSSPNRECCGRSAGATGLDMTERH